MRIIGSPVGPVIIRPIGIPSREVVGIPRIFLPFRRRGRALVKTSVNALELAEYIERHADDYAAKSGPGFKMEF